MKPKVSLYTSLFKGAKHLKGFLEDVERQTIFKECELVIINANSPEREEEEAILKPYLHKHRGHGNGLIKYSVLDSDPGVYAVWNKCIKECSSDLISNANVDDRKHPEHLEMHYQGLKDNPDIDLTYAEVAVTYKANETMEKNSVVLIQNFPEYSFINLIKYNNSIFSRACGAAGMSHHMNKLNLLFFLEGDEVTGLQRAHGQRSQGAQDRIG